MSLLNSFLKSSKILPKNLPRKGFESKVETIRNDIISSLLEYLNDIPIKGRNVEILDEKKTSLVGLLVESLSDKKIRMDKKTLLTKGCLVRILDKNKKLVEGTFVRTIRKTSNPKTGNLAKPGHLGRLKMVFLDYVAYVMEHPDKTRYERPMSLDSVSSVTYDMIEKVEKEVKENKNQYILFIRKILQDYGITPEIIFFMEEENFEENIYHELLDKFNDLKYRVNGDNITLNDISPTMIVWRLMKIFLYTFQCKVEREDKQSSLTEDLKIHYGIQKFLQHKFSLEFQLSFRLGV